MGQAAAPTTAPILAPTASPSSPRRTAALPMTKSRTDHPAGRRQAAPLLHCVRCCRSAMASLMLDSFPAERLRHVVRWVALLNLAYFGVEFAVEIGTASCRERVFQYV